MLPVAAAPLYRVGDIVYPVDTGFYHPTGTYDFTHAIIIEEASAWGADYLTNIFKTSWSGPSGYLYKVNLYNHNGLITEHQGLAFHELELIKLCKLP